MNWDEAIQVMNDGVRTSQQQELGCVYVLTSPFFPGFVKIGMSTRRAEYRAAEINATTGTPHGYMVHHQRAVDDPYYHEAEIMRRLADFRVKGNEIFNLPASVAARVIDEVVDGLTIVAKPPAGAALTPGAAEIGSVIRNKRKLLGITQSQLAAMCGTGERFIVEAEAGKETAQIGKVMCVLSALGISVFASS